MTALLALSAEQGLCDDTVSVRPPVCLSHHGPTAANALWAWRVGDIDRLLHDRRSAAAAGECGQYHGSAYTKKAEHRLAYKNSEKKIFCWITVYFVSFEACCCHAQLTCQINLSCSLFRRQDVAIHSAAIARLVSAVIKFLRAPNDIDPFATYATWSNKIYSRAPRTSERAPSTGEIFPKRERERELEKYVACMSGRREYALRWCDSRAIHLLSIDPAPLKLTTHATRANRFYHQWPVYVALRAPFPSHAITLCGLLRPWSSNTP